jgi:ribose 1,5-bisphosphokinase PhnN
MTLQSRSLIILVGASGVGKTTLQRSLNPSIPVLKRMATRSLQHPEEENEITPVTLSEFQSAKELGNLLLDYERYGNCYGLEKKELERIQPGGLGVIALPAKNISQLRQVLSAEWKVFTCWLAADTDVVNQRLENRRDEATKITSRLRRKNHSVDHSSISDCILDAHASEQEVQEQFQLWTEKILGKGFGLNSEALQETHEVRNYLNDSPEEWAIFGSMAAQWYAREVYRQPTDVDFILSSPTVEHLLREDSQLKFVKSTTLQGKYVELRGRKLTLHVGPEKYYWEFDEEAQRRRNQMRIGDSYYPVLSAEDIIAMKCILQRGVDRNKFDIEDVTRLLANYRGRINLNYLRYRADICKATDRVQACLGELGVALNS